MSPMAFEWWGSVAYQITPSIHLLSWFLGFYPKPLPQLCLLQQLLQFFLQLAVLLPLILYCFGWRFIYGWNYCSSRSTEVIHLCSTTKSYNNMLDDKVLTYLVHLFSFLLLLGHCITCHYINFNWSHAMMNMNQFITRFHCGYFFMFRPVTTISMQEKNV